MPGYIRLKDTRVRALNEPRIIGPFYDAPLLIAENLSVIYKRDREGRRWYRRTLRSVTHTYTYIHIHCSHVFSAASAWRYADSVRREIIDERCVTNRASCGTFECGILEASRMEGNLKKRESYLRVHIAISHRYRREIRTWNISQKRVERDFSGTRLQGGKRLNYANFYIDLP